MAQKAYEDFNISGSIYLTQYFNTDYVVEDFWKELKKLGAKNWTENEYINNVFYKIRNYVVNSDNYLSDKVSCFIFKKLLLKKDINSDLIISVSNITTNLNEILFESEIKYIVKVNNDYFCNVTDHSMLNQMPEVLQGNQAYIIEAPQKNKEQIIKPLILPIATYLQNKTVFNISSELLKDINTLAVKKTTISNGNNKTRNIYTALKYTPYMFVDYINYGGESPIDKAKESEKEEYFKSIKALKEQYAKLKQEQVQDYLESEFSQKVKYKTHSLTSDGRTNKQKELITTEEFELLGMVKKAGKKLLINISGLVGSQLQIKKDELDRKVDIDVSYERALTWNIEFKIPEGYTAEGLKELAKKVDNEIGTFDCITEEKNGSINIVINKIYKKANIPKAKWLDMVAFVDAAYNASFKYILLKQKP